MRVRKMMPERHTVAPRMKRMRTPMLMTPTLRAKKKMRNLSQELKYVRVARVWVP